MDEIKDSSALRPYYDPETFNVGYSAVFRPDKGVIDQDGLNIASKLSIANQSPAGSLKSLNERFSGGGGLRELTTGVKKKLLDSVTSTRQGIGAKSLNDLEWNDLLNVNIWKQLLEKLMRQLSSKYFHHLVRQPFKVANLLLQVGDFDYVTGDARSGGLSEAYNDSDECDDSQIDGDGDGDDDDENDETEPNFFVTESEARLIDRKVKKRKSDVAENNALIRPDSIRTIDILNSVMDKEGIQGVWRANNTEFIYNFLSISLDAWFTGLLSPLLQIPDPYFIDIIHSPDVTKTASLILLASCMTSLVLLPLDLIRVRLMITRVNSADEERSLRKLLKKWSWRDNFSKLNKELIFLNVIHSLIGTGFTKLTGAVLYQEFGIDKYTNAVLYNTMKFCSKVVGFFVKLPIENLLRRCQVKFLLSGSALKVERKSLIVKPREYKSIYHTVFHERDRIGELWRGWRLGMMSILCGYGLKILNKPSEALEEEKF